MRKPVFSYIIPVAVFLLPALSSLNTFAIDPIPDFQKANKLYQQKSFDSAAIIYERLIAQQYLAPELYYNLGNCYYKTGDAAKAILNYERALKYRPGDEDINFNLKVAQLKIVDKIEPVPDIFYIRWIHKLSSLLTGKQWAILVIILWCCVFIALAVYLLSFSTPVKRTGFIFALIFLIIMAASWLIARQNYISNKVDKSAVVMSISVYVKSSPGENNTDLFVLHEGAKVNVLDEYEDWLKIKIANGSVGWLKRSDVEEI